MFRITKKTHEAPYASPFQSGADGNNVHVKVDVSALTSREVDANGYLKPGVPLVQGTGVLPTAAGDVVVMVEEATKIAENNTGLASITADPFIGCRVYGTVNHDMLADILGAELTAGEIAAINGGGSRLRLTQRSA